MIGKSEIQRIVERAKELDRKALTELCEYFYPKIYRYVFYRVKTREDAEDITSEVFIRMINSLHKQRGFFPAWLFRIASNLVIDYYRRQASHKEVLLVKENVASSEYAQDDIEKTLLQNRLKQALCKLTQEQQEMITLKFIEGYNNNEIADILGKSVGAVKGLQFRALAALKGIL